MKKSDEIEVFVIPNKGREELEQKILNKVYKKAMKLEYNKRINFIIDELNKKGIYAVGFKVFI